LRAQVAANAKGEAEVRAMIDHFGLDVVLAYMRHIQDNAEEAVRRVIDALEDGAAEYETDSGDRIVVTVRVDRAAREATIDFTGTTAQLASNRNAPAAVTTAAVLYVFRTLVADDIPLNDGCLRPLHIIVPRPSMLAPEHPAAVVGGNVETSQAVTGALYRALGVQAEGSGTMNNVTFGNARHQYYETVASGSGAGPGFHGTAVVQTHMTNSRLTDPEVLETRSPVLVDSSAVRRASTGAPAAGGAPACDGTAGGQTHMSNSRPPDPKVLDARNPVLVDSFAGRRGSAAAGPWRGGDGAVRPLRFTEPMTVSLLAGHSRV